MHCGRSAPHGLSRRAWAWAACAALAQLSCTGARPALPTTQTAARWTPDAISTPAYESTPTFSPDGRTMVYMRADADFSSYRLAQTTCVDGAWSAPVPLPFAAAPPAMDADPFLTRDGRGLYFVSNRHAPHTQDLDIHHVVRGSDGRWGTPVRLPAPVNSGKSELLPRMDGEGALYFGSGRPGGAGLGDIYRAVRDAGGRWTVETLGAPVNTPADEYEAEISRDGSTLVVVAQREGKSHLYRYRRTPDGWQARGRIPAFDRQFQVGPLLSPRADRLLFAQRDGRHSGEMFLIDLVPPADASWPPACGGR